MLTYQFRFILSIRTAIRITIVAHILRMITPGFPGASRFVFVYAHVTYCVLTLYIFRQSAIAGFLVFFTFLSRRSSFGVRHRFRFPEVFVSQNLIGFLYQVHNQLFTTRQNDPGQARNCTDRIVDKIDVSVSRKSGAHHVDDGHYLSIHFVKGIIGGFRRMRSSQ